MTLRKYRWSKDYESNEEELQRLFQAKRIPAERLTAYEFENFAEQVNKSDTTLWCAEGSIRLVVGDQQFSLQPGDALDVPAQRRYSAVAGISGCVWYEAHYRVR